MKEDKEVSKFRIGLIARFTRDHEVAISSNLLASFNNLERVVHCVDEMIDTTYSETAMFDLTHLRARVQTAANILLEELEQLHENQKHHQQ